MQNLTAKSKYVSKNLNALLNHNLATLCKTHELRLVGYYLSYALIFIK